MHNTIKPVLIFTWGNPSRGDDALGPKMYQRLQKLNSNEIDVLTDFQLQIEHAVDLENRERVLFIDASVSAAEPFEFYQLKPAEDASYTTHAMSPQSLLATYEKVNQKTPPPAFMLSIRGYEFDLGQPVSARALNNLAAASTLVQRLLRKRSTDGWIRLAKQCAAPDLVC